MLASYQKNRTPAGWQFDVTPATAPRGIGIKIFLYGGFFVIAAIIGAVVSDDNTPRGYSHSTNSNGLLTFIILYGAVAGLITWHFRRLERKLRRPSRFIAGADGLSIGGKLVPGTEIHRFVMRNWVAKYETEVTVTAFVGSGVGGAIQGAAIGMADISRQAGRAYERKLAETCWQLDVEASGRATTIAWGLDDVTANGLMRDINRALDE